MKRFTGFFCRSVKHPDTVVEGKDLAACRKEVRKLIASRRVGFTWITDHATGERFTLRAELKS